MTMTKSKANKILADAGMPDLEVHKAEGVWYIVGDGVTNFDIESCLHAVRLEQIRECDLIELAIKLTN